VLRFDANLNFLFQEAPFYARFERARRAGFSHIEFLDVLPLDLATLTAAIADAGLQVVQFNFLDGDMPAGERGIASHPDRRGDWRAGFLRALEIARQLRPRQMHSLAGVALPALPREDQLAVLVENLAWAAPHLERAGLALNLEPLNAGDNPGYLLQTVEEAVEVLRRVGSPYVRLQFDFYHIQRSQGDLIRRLRAAAPYVSHTQIADNPGRHEPGTGEIHYRSVLLALENVGYAGFVGLEFVPTGEVESALAWLPRPARSQGCGAAELGL